MKAALARWREALSARGTLSDEDLDELESHLLDHVDALAADGVDRTEAFERAAASLGDVQEIGDEFAKVNPLLAWRSALFWICAGVLTVLGLRPVQVLASHGVVAGSLALGLPRVVTSILVWAVALGSALVFFASAFLLVRLRARVVALFTSPLARILAIVGAAATMLAEHLGSSWGWFFALERRAFDFAALDHAWTTFWTATQVLGVVAPIALAGFALHQRARARESSAFWLAVGFFVGTVRCEVHELVRLLTLAGAAASHLDAAQTGALVWTVTLASPCLLAAGTYTLLQHRAPAPAGVARGYGVVASLGFGTVAAIAAVFTTRPVGSHAVRMIDSDAYAAGIDAWFFSSILMSAVLPIFVGALTFRLRQKVT